MLILMATKAQQIKASLSRIKQAVMLLLDDGQKLKKD
jgi:hypothetical protein